VDRTLTAMTRTDMIALARQKASDHGLPPELVCAIVEQESSWKPAAIRYEPRFYEKYVYPIWLRGEIAESEARARAFSWGLCQVMGQVAREHGYAGEFLSELCAPDSALEMGCKVLAHKLAVNEGNVERALLAWNGGANHKYPAEVLARVAKYQ
jgi:soluble lytic murein transglycosylase-like protein